MVPLPKVCLSPQMLWHNPALRCRDLCLSLHVIHVIELFCGTKIFIKGDKVPRDEAALIIMNHRCRLDWMFYFMVLLRNGRLEHEKIILRDDLKLVPGPGKSNIIHICILQVALKGMPAKNLKSSI